MNMMVGVCVPLDSPRLQNQESLMGQKGQGREGKVSLPPDDNR